MKRLLVLGAAGVLMLSLWTATPAQAAGSATCSISGTAHFTPGLTTTAQAVSYTFGGKAANCNSSVKTLKSGTISASGSGAKLSCTGGNSAGTGSIAWNNGTVSGFSFTTAGSGPEVKVTGKITSGQFAGLNITAALVFAANPLQCRSGGVASASFNGASRVA